MLRLSLQRNFHHQHCCGPTLGHLRAAHDCNITQKPQKTQYQVHHVLCVVFHCTVAVLWRDGVCTRGKHDQVRLGQRGTAEERVGQVLSRENGCTHTHTHTHTAGVKSSRLVEQHLLCLFYSQPKHVWYLATENTFSFYNWLVAVPFNCITGHCTACS